MREKVSLCIPVKNSEKTIARCVSSVGRVFDQLVILDSGCSDCTLDIVQKFGAEIHPAKAADNHAENYNYLFSLAKYDYILFLHSDEYVSEGSRELLETHLMVGNIRKNHAVRFKRRDIDRFRDYSFMGRERFLYRLMHRDAGSWKFPVHEYFFTTGGSMNSDIVIYNDHQAVSLSEDAKRGKNRDILDRFLAEKPSLAHDEACRIYLLSASDHLALREFSRALDLFNEAIHRGQQAKEQSTGRWLRRSWLGKGLAYYMTGRINEAEKTLFMTDDFPDTVLEKYYVLARISQVLGKPEEAFHYFKIALNNRSYSDTCFFFPPFRVVFNLMADALDAAAALDYRNKTKEIRDQLEKGFGNILPFRDELRLFPEQGRTIS